MNKFKFLISFGLILFLFLFLVKPSWAVVVKTAGDLELVLDTEPLFGSDIIWYPGLSETRNLTVKNIGSETHRTYFRADNTSEDGNLSTVMYFKINEGGTVFYGGSDSKTMRNFWGDGEVILSDIEAKKSTIYNIAITFWRGAGNEFQETQAKFDLVIGFEGTEDEVVVPAGPDGGDGGGSGGVSGDTDIGGGDVVGSSSWSDLTFTAGVGGWPWVYAPAEEGDVEGIETKGEKASEVSKPEVKGDAVCNWHYYLWWLTLVIQGALTFIYYRWLNAKGASVKNAKIAYWWCLPVILAILSQIVHEILGCKCITSGLCPWYWLFNLFILAGLTLLFIYGKRNHNKR